MSYLLIESIDKAKLVKVISATPTKAKFTAALQTANEVNKNNRYYPKEVIDEAIKSAKDRIKDRRFGGELDHPIPTSDEKFSAIRHTTPLLKEMSHIITDPHWDGNTLMGFVETTTTPQGFILAGLIYDKVRVGFSIRAISDNVKYRDDGVQVVGSPMTIIAIDAVSIPSHTGAFLKEIKHLESMMQQYQQMKCENGMCVLSEHLDKIHSKYNILENSTYKRVKNKILEYYEGKPFKF